MDAIKLPTEKAIEPVEQAHQPPNDTTMAPEECNNSKKRHATFADNVTDNELSQNSSTYKEVLSQPAPNLSHKHRLMWLQQRRGPGLWAQCDSCDSWRHLPHVLDAHQLPARWYCSMNPDKAMADCSVPETPLRTTDEEDLIHSEYSAGSLVWARLPGWPWWPAMVDDCPDTEQFYWLDGFSDIPTHYNVVFFDATDVTRAWISLEYLKPYTTNKQRFKHQQNVKKYKKRLEAATKQADKAEKLPVRDRLAEFSFISQFKGPILSPKKVSKQVLEKFQNKLKRKFNVDFPVEVSSGSEDESIQAFRENNKRKNVILIGTPKSNKIKRARVSKNDKDNEIVKNYKKKTNDVDIEKNQLNETNHESPIKRNEVKGSSNTGLVKLDDNKTEITDVNPEPTATNEKSSESVVELVSTNGLSSGTFKPPNSMAIEIGSTTHLESEFSGIDNGKPDMFTCPQATRQSDKPKTYRPFLDKTQREQSVLQMRYVSISRKFSNQDSSKTYVPDNTSDLVDITKDFQICMETPSSDDFEF